MYTITIDDKTIEAHIHPEIYNLPNGKPFERIEYTRCSIPLNILAERNTGESDIDFIQRVYKLLGAGVKT